MIYGRSIARSLRLAHGRRAAPRGFTLLEVLLAVAILGVLAGAAVLSFSSLRHGAELNEGTSRFESLLRFARAEAAFTGHRVQIKFAPHTESSLGDSNRYLARLACERQPLEEPGVFVELDPLPWLNRTLDALVAVESVRPLAPTPADTAEETPSPEAFPSASTATNAGLPPPITFYPDGSSDSVEITLVSVDPQDARRTQLRVNGLTGSVRQGAATTPADESTAVDRWEATEPTTEAMGE